MKLPKWMKAAILLSLSFFMAIWLVKPVGVSTQFSVVSGMIHTAIDSEVLETNEYYQKDNGAIADEIENPWNYNFIFVLAIPVGGVVGHIFDAKKRQPQKPEACVLKESVWKTYVLPFISGALLLFGARMAGGCTSGHMMSGMMQSSVSGYIFAASVFSLAIPTAILVSRIRERKGSM